MADISADSQVLVEYRLNVDQVSANTSQVLVNKLTITYLLLVREAVASWLVHLTLEQAVWIQALARYIALRSWARYFTPSVSARKFYLRAKVAPEDLF